jgi:ParB-like chromosome segregation protein Spo0J
MMESLVASIKEFGVVDPVIALPDGRIIGGNQRLEAAKKAGLTELPVVRVKLSETKAKKLNIALNRISGEFEDDTLAVWLRELQEAEENLFSAGFEEEAITQLLAEYDQRHPTDSLALEPIRWEGEELRAKIVITCPESEQETIRKSIRELLGDRNDIGIF